MQNEIELKEKSLQNELAIQDIHTQIETAQLEGECNEAFIRANAECTDGQCIFVKSASVIGQKANHPCLLCNIDMSLFNNVDRWTPMYW